jgi:uncharacterized protein (DUF3820 family)
MTETQQKPPSYTQQLKDHMVKNKCPKKYVDLISVFALEYSTKMEEQKKEMIGIMNFGKYKGKKIKDIIELDKPYVMWLQKNQKYLNDDNKQIVEELLKVE